MPRYLLAIMCIQSDIYTTERKYTESGGTDMNRNTYWNSNGECQKEYDTMIKAEENGTFSFTKASEKLFHSYYRYYNDGDLPGWARSRWDLTRYGRFGRELNEAGEQMLEDKVTDRILAEWTRYQKKNR